MTVRTWVPRPIATWYTARPGEGAGRGVGAAGGTADARSQAGGVKLLSVFFTAATRLPTAL